MAIAKATCRCKTCGDEFEYRAYKRNRREADSFEAWAAEHITECPDCRKERIKRERDEANRQAAESAKELGFPTLTGSEKQIAWAEKIRMDAVAAINEEANKWAQLNEEKAVTEITNFRRWMLAHDKAAFWIDRRDEVDTFRRMINLYQAYKEAQK